VLTFTAATCLSVAQSKLGDQPGADQTGHTRAGKARRCSGAGCEGWCAPRGNIVCLPVAPHDMACEQVLCSQGQHSEAGVPGGTGAEWLTVQHIKLIQIAMLSSNWVFVLCQQLLLLSHGFGRSHENHMCICLAGVWLSTGLCMSWVST
jgi:hypothetical protein